MIASSQSGTSGLSSRIGRCRSSQTRLSTAIAESARNGDRPAAIAYSAAPSAKRSARASTGSPRACSGAMYCGVPAIRPLWVRLASSMALARPKSVSLTRSTQFSSRMFAGLMSRCTTPCGMGGRQGAGRLRADPQDLAHLQRPDASSFSWSERPGTYCMTR